MTVEASMTVVAPEVMEATVVKKALKGNILIVRYESVVRYELLLKAYII